MTTQNDLLIRSVKSTADLSAMMIRAAMLPAQMSHEYWRLSMAMPRATWAAMTSHHPFGIPGDLSKPALTRATKAAEATARKSAVSKSDGKATKPVSADIEVLEAPKPAEPALAKQKPTGKKAATKKAATKTAASKTDDTKQAQNKRTSAKPAAKTFVKKAPVKKPGTDAAAKAETAKAEAPKTKNPATKPETKPALTGRSGQTTKPAKADALTKPAQPTEKPSATKPATPDPKTGTKAEPTTQAEIKTPAKESYEVKSSSTNARKSVSLAAAPTPAKNETPTPKSATTPEPAAANSTQPSGSQASAAKPSMLAKPRGGKPDDLKQISGVGEQVEKTLNDMGVYHFDQVAGWNAGEVEWVDDNLPGIKGRISRDKWVDQSKALSAGAQTKSGS